MHKTTPSALVRVLMTDRDRIVGRVRLALKRTTGDHADAAVGVFEDELDELLRGVDNFATSAPARRPETIAAEEVRKLQRDTGFVDALPFARAVANSLLISVATELELRATAVAEGAQRISVAPVLDGGVVPGSFRGQRERMTEALSQEQARAKRVDEVAKELEAMVTDHVPSSGEIETMFQATTAQTGGVVRVDRNTWPTHTLIRQAVRLGLRLIAAPIIDDLRTKVAELEAHGRARLGELTQKDHAMFVRAGEAAVAAFRRTNPDELEHPADILLVLQTIAEAAYGAQDMFCQDLRKKRQALRQPVLPAQGNGARGDEARRRAGDAFIDMLLNLDVAEVDDHPTLLGMICQVAEAAHGENDVFCKELRAQQRRLRDARARSAPRTTPAPPPLEAQAVDDMEPKDTVNPGAPPWDRIGLDEQNVDILGWLARAILQDGSAALGRYQARVRALLRAVRVVAISLGVDPADIIR